MGTGGSRTPAQHPTPRTPVALHRGGSPSARPLARSFPAAIVGAVPPVPSPPSPRRLKAKRSAVRPPPHPVPFPLRLGSDVTQSIGGSTRCTARGGGPKCGNFILEAKGGRWRGGEVRHPLPSWTAWVRDSGGCSGHCPPGGQNFPCRSASAHEGLGLNPC